MASSAKGADPVCVVEVQLLVGGGHSGGKKGRDAAVKLSLPGRDLRKGQVAVRYHFYENVYLSVKMTQHNLREVYHKIHRFSIPLLYFRNLICGYRKVYIFVTNVMK